MTQFVDSATAGMKLKSTKGWASGFYPDTVGLDSYGFRMLPAGILGDAGYFTDVHTGTYFMSSSENDAAFAWQRYFFYGSAYVTRSYNGKTWGLSLRCIAD